MSGSKRYAENDDEQAVILARRNTVLAELFDFLDGQEWSNTALVFTCAWGEHSGRTRRPDLVAADPGATFWRNDLWDPDPDCDDNMWTRLWVSTRPWFPGGFDSLLALAADDRTGGIIVAPLSLQWLYHPYDGVADVVAPSETARDRLAAEHEDWLPEHPLGL